MLYDNIHTKIFSLPDDTIIYPGHDYKGRTATSVAEERALNPRLTKSKQAFVDIMNNLNLPLPKQIQRSLPANLKDGVDFPYA
jgi:sulfur dioxygenase